MKFRKWFDKRIFLVNKLYSQLKKGFDVEALHQYRINLRKLYSCSEVYAKEIDETGSKKFSKLIKNIIKPTAALRDIDLFILEIDTIECSRKTKEKLYDIFNSKREKAFKKYKDTVNGRGYKKNLKELNFITKEIDFFIFNMQNIDKHEIIKNREINVYEEYGSIDINTPYKELHNLRKEFKKFRYGLEVYEQCFKEDKEEFCDITNLKELQEEFGAIQDNYVRLEMLMNVGNTLSKKQRVKLEEYFKLLLQKARDKLLIHRDSNIYNQYCLLNK